MNPLSREIAILSDQALSDLTLPVSLPSSFRERVEKLKICYAYSIRLLLIYQAVLAVIVLLISLRRWYNAKLGSNRQNRHSNINSLEKERSGAQWFKILFKQIEDTRNPARYERTDANEDTPLVASAAKQTVLSNAWTRCRSILMYQPRPLPVFNRTMPSNATSLLITGLFGINVFYLLFEINFSAIDAPSLIGNRAGCLFVANLPWLYLLAAKHQPIQVLTGYSYENINILHRRLGEWLCFIAVLHVAGMIMSWNNLLRPLGLTFPQFLTITYILFGVCTFVCYKVLFLTSLASFRVWWYELFLGCHVFFQLMALVLLFLHHHRGRVYVGIALAVAITDRLMLRLGMKTRSFDAQLTVLDDGHTVLVSADWPLPSTDERTWLSWINRDVRRGWSPGEHVFITIPALGRKHTIQAHPFTIASAAPSKNAAHAWLNLVIRAQNGFSQDLLQFANSHASVMVRLDGPYGSRHALEMLQSNDLCIVVAGGSGIAVAYPLLWYSLQAVQRGRRSIANSCFHLVWVVQETSHLSWLGLERLDELREMGLHIILPLPTKDHGRPNMHAMLSDLIWNNGEALIDHTRVGVLVSGPDQLNRSVRNTCAEMVGEGWKINVAIEKYGW